MVLVLLLSAADGPGPGLRPGSGTEKLTTGGARLGMTHGTIAQLRHLLELSTGEPYEVPLERFFRERARRVAMAGG